MKTVSNVSFQQRPDGSCVSYVELASSDQYIAINGVPRFYFARNWILELIDQQC